MRHAVKMLLVPLALLVSALSILILPFSHGGLARKSVDYETVVVKLKPVDAARYWDWDGSGDGMKIPSSTVPANQGSENSPQIPASVSTPALLNHCSKEELSAIDASSSAVLIAMREVMRLHAVEEGELNKALVDYSEKVLELGDRVVSAKCLGATRLFWATAPHMGVIIENPQIHEYWLAALNKVRQWLPLRKGVLLQYPREKEILQLVTTQLPKTPFGPGQWELTELPSRAVSDVTVSSAYDSFRLNDAIASAALKPDHDAIKKTMQSLSPSALQGNLNALDNGYYYAEASGVAITALGAQTRVNLLAYPALARRSIKWQSEVMNGRKQLGGDPVSLPSRRTAVPSLHVTESIWAELLLADSITSFDWNSCRNNKVRGPEIAVGCMPETLSAAGFLLQVLRGQALEIARYFPQKYQQRKSKILDSSADDLLQYLLNGANSDATSDGEKAAICSALVNAGTREFPSDSELEVFLVILG